MTHKTKIGLVIFIFVVLYSFNLFSCTTFCLEDDNGALYFGRNFDFPTGIGDIQINQRNVKKTSFPLQDEKPFTWTSKYGSISFNQNGREFPYGGINEAGLVIEQLMMEKTQYPEKDERSGLEELQWIQYQLDMAATVEDVIASDEFLRISNNSFAPLHFSVVDSDDNFGVIEYLNGEMVSYTGDEASCHVLANECYSSGLSKKIENDTSQRFVMAANMVESFNPKDEDGLDYLFDILKKVSQGEWTRWSIVYDINNLSIHYFTGNNKTIRKIDLKNIDFSCSPEKLYINIDSNYTNPQDFQKYNYEYNFGMVDKVWSNVEFLSAIPMEFRKAWAKYPDDVSCGN